MLININQYLLSEIFMLNKTKQMFEVLTRFVPDLCIWRKLSNFVTRNQEEANASSFYCIKN